MQSDPTDIRETSPHELQITWADGHVSRFTYAWMREHCPCAMCRKRKRDGGVDSLLASMVRPDTTARDVQVVGRYAVHVTFSDSHDSGIFPFDMLRAACDCGACANRAGAPSS